MKVVVLAGDESILVSGSRSHDRMGAYARLFEAYHIIVASRGAHPDASSGGLRTYAAQGGTTLGRLLRLTTRAWAVCHETHPDVVSSETPDAFGLVGYLLSRRFRIPLQVQVHTDVLSPFYRRASWKERLRYRLALFVLPRATRIRAVSVRIADSIARELAIPASRIHVLPMWTEAEPIRHAPPPAAGMERLRGSELRLISAGRFVDREKNFSMLIDAMRHVVRQAPRSLLVLAGQGPDQKLLERRIRQRGLEAQVWIEPWREDLPSFLESFDLFLLASNFEGAPRVCFEAVAAGLPLITTDVGLAGDLWVDGVTAEIVPVGDIKAMAGAILRLYRDPERRRTLVQAARDAVGRLPNRSKEDYLQSYRGAMEACLER